MTDKQFSFERDWENEGAISYKNAKTLDTYHRLCDERRNVDVSKFDMFFAFSNEQFEQGKKTVRPLKEGERWVSFGAGCFGTKDGIQRYIDYSKSIDRRIEAECDPQEVYCYEFNNYESMYAYDGDEDAIRMVASIWGWEVAKTVKRFCVFSSIEQLMTNEEN